MNIEKNILDHCLRLWKYHHINQELSTADFVLALGSADDRVAIHAAYLIKLNYSNLIISSGGLGKITRELYKDSEGERFASIIETCGVIRDKIIIEPNASNTGENLLFSKAILSEMDIVVRTGILVTKPYMERRALATACKQWPEITWQVSSPLLTFERYVEYSNISLESTINLMVGDLQRIKVYAEKGFQTPQYIPEEIWSSYEYLRDRGYDKFVIYD